MAGKRKLKFRAEITLEQLQNVPYVNAILFAKVKVNQADFAGTTPRNHVKNHQVTWDSTFTLDCKMVKNDLGVLKPCICRVSIRKETQGGQAFDRLGAVDINLAEYAGAGETSKKFILRSEKKKSQDNSVLIVGMTLKQISGDPCFKTPRVQSMEGIAQFEVSSPSAFDLGVGMSTLEINDLVEGTEGRALGRSLSEGAHHSPMVTSKVLQRSRVDADNVVDELLKASTQSLTSNEEEESLQLYTQRDGSVSFANPSIRGAALKARSFGAT